MISLLRKLVPPSEFCKLLGAVIVIAANAGSAWTPIGDVTTTMLWIHGQISTFQTMKRSKWERTSFSQCFGIRTNGFERTTCFLLRPHSSLNAPETRIDEGKTVGLPTIL